MLPHRLCCDVASNTETEKTILQRPPGTLATCLVYHTQQRRGVIPPGFNPAQVHISGADYALQTGHLHTSQNGILNIIRSRRLSLGLGRLVPINNV